MRLTERNRDRMLAKRAAERLRNRWHGAAGERKRAIMLHLISVGSASKSELIFALPVLQSIHDHEVVRTLGLLVEENMIVRLGTSRNRRFQLTDHGLTAIAP